MRTRISLCMVFMAIALSQAVPAQDFAGTYVMSSQGVTVTLVLKQDARGTLTGTLSSTKGTQFKIEGQVEAEAATGVCSGKEGRAFFEAYFEGNILQFNMIEVDASNNPDYTKVRGLQFSRQASSVLDGLPPGKPSIKTRPGPKTETQTTTASGEGVLQEKQSGASKAGAVRDPDMGISFTPPSGWIAQKQESGYLLGSNTYKGFILILPHEFTSVEQMRQEASEGILDEGSGIQLLPVRDFQRFQQNGLIGEFSGVVQGRDAKAYAIGLISPRGGGVTIMAAVESASYSQEYPQFVKSIASSLSFSAPQAGAAGSGGAQSDASLMSYFAGKYYSFTSGSTIYGSGGTERRVMLCPNGLFYDSSESGSYGQGWGAASQGGGGGRWSIGGSKTQGVITIRYQNGETRRVNYQVESKGVIYFDGIKFAYEGPPECGR